jgi:adenylate cyclase
VEYGSSQEGEGQQNWQRSPFYHLYSRNETELRLTLSPEIGERYPVLGTMHADGQTDYLALMQRFSPEGSMGEMDCVFSHWTTDHAEGFCDADMEGLRRLVPTLALGIKCASLARVAGTLVEVYLGRDAGRRVLQGRIARGVAERIDAALWFSDLRGFTAITDSAPPETIIPLLNDYAEAAIGAIEQAGGDVLKLIGDGTLAIFQAENRADACRAALGAEADFRARLKALNLRREAQGQPITTAYTGLHIGEVFFGNIGSNTRLDFTVVGPAVNETSRIASMCRAVDRPMVVSAAFAGCLPGAERESLVSVGRFALRGVGRAQELFTLDPARLG